MDDLKIRSERIERKAWKDLYESAPESLRRALGLGVLERRGVTHLSASRVDHLLLNRAIGLGSTASHGTEEAAATVRYYARRGIERYWIHLSSRLRGSGLPRDLAAHGVLPYPRSWMKFVRTAGPIDSFPCDLQVRPARKVDAARISEIVAPSFDLPMTAGALFTAALGAKDWYYLVAEEEGRVIAAAALRVCGRDSLLVFAATDPAHRLRGAQRALMAARLAQAKQLGCGHSFTETGLPKPGERGSSYRNILRAGFDELYVRDNFAPEGTQWQKSPSSDATTKSNVYPRPSRTHRLVADRFGS